MTIRGDKTDKILEKADKYAHTAYGLARKLPKEELFGLGSQLRRAALSVPLNVVEGYARQSMKSQIQFLRVAYGSLKEAQYIIQFAVEEDYFSASDSQEAYLLGDECAGLLWSPTQTLCKRVEQEANR